MERSDAFDVVLAELDRAAGDLLAEAAALVRNPSVGGSDEENAVQHALAERFERDGLEVDHWAVAWTPAHCGAEGPAPPLDRPASEPALGTVEQPT